MKDLSGTVAQHVEQLPHSAIDPSSILTSGVGVEFARYPRDRVCFLRMLGFSPTSRKRMGLQVNWSPQIAPSG